MRPIYEADSLYLAQLLVNRLSQHRIETVVRNAHLQGALGELPMSVNPIVCVVEDNDWAEAVVIAGDFVKAMNRPPGPPRKCSNCREQSPGNFPECWQCRKPFPESAQVD